MDYEDRRPKQLEIRRQQHYDNVYGKQKQLMKRLRPLLNKSDLIEEHTEPIHYSIKDKIKKPKKNQMKLKKEINVFESKKKLKKIKTPKKISDIRPDILWALSLK